jgi:hypothetical protein
MSEENDKKSKIEAPGTLVLVFIFLAWFITLYFLNWSALSKIWSIG